MTQEEKQRVVAALSSSVEEIRYQAARRLPEVFERAPVKHLLHALGDESWRVRKCATEIIIGTPATDELIEALLQALGADENVGLRNSATEVLVQLGPPAVSGLIRVLQDGDKDERKLAADTLGDITDKRAVEPLIKSLVDQDENVRAAAAEALGMIGEPGAVGHLIALLDKEGLLVQLSCLDALDRMGAEVPAESLHSLLSLGPLRPHVYRLLGKVRDASVVPVLLQGLGARGKMERAAASRALVQQYRAADKQGRVEIRVAVARAASDQVVGNITDMLESASPEEREAAIALLGWTGREAAIEPLIRAATEEQFREPIYEAILAIGPKAAEALCEMLDGLGRLETTLAVEILGHFGLPSSLSPLVELSLSEEPEVADTAQRALGRVGNRSVIDTLADLLKRESGQPPHGVVAALAGLGARFHDDVVEVVTPLLEGERPLLRVAAAQVLCEIARKADLDEIVRLLGDEDPGVRIAAVEALGRVGGTDAVERIRITMTDESPDVRAAAACALGNRDSPEARQLLGIALRDEESLVVREALRALGRSGAADAAELLLPFVTHGNGAVALEAVRALNRLGWRGDPGRLRQASRHQDPEVVKEVLAGLDRWPVDEVREVLVGALDDRNWDVRMAAVKKVGVLRDPVAVQAVFERLSSEEDDLVRETMEKVLAVGKRGSETE